jgi:iron complex outermembrane receptor protein
MKPHAARRSSAPAGRVAASLVSFWRLHVQHKKQILGLAVLAACGGYASNGVAQTTSGNNRDIEELLVFGTQGARESATASRLDLTLLETPATVDIIDGDAIRARIDTNLLEAVTRSAGFTNESNPGNGNSSIAARGFNGQGSVTKLYDGTSYFTAAETITFPFDTWGVEQVEVLKGPSSVLYGEGGIGGAINIIPRRPQRERAGDVRVIMGQDSTAFVGLDYTAGLGDSAAFRVDYSNSQSDNWVRDGESESEMLSLALTWDVTDDLELSARYDMGDQKPMRYFGIPVVNGDFFEPFLESNFNVGDSDVHYEDDSVRLKADWQASDTVSLQAELYRLSTERVWKNSEYYFYDDTAQLLERYDPLMIGHDMDHTGARANLLFAPSSAVTASVGVELNDISFARPTNFGPGNPNPIDFDNDFQVVDPFNFQPGLLADLTDASYVPDNESDVTQRAVFGEAQFHATDRFAVVAALRWDDYDTFYQRVGRAPVDQQVDSLTGRVGLVFDIDADTAFYAQYGTGATHPGSSVVTASAINAQADMIESEQLEVGIKHQVTDTGLSFNLAVFDITKNNLVEDDPTSGNPNDLLLIPEQTSTGIEVGFTLAVSDSFQVYGNLAALDAETDTGETPLFVPEETMNAGVVWSVSEAVRLLADVRYVGERFDSSIPIPAYTVVDASVRFDASNNVGLTVKAENLFDALYATANYYSDTWFVGRPRTMSVAFDYRF